MVNLYLLPRIQRFLKTRDAFPNPQKLRAYVDKDEVVIDIRGVGISARVQISSDDILKMAEDITNARNAQTKKVGENNETL